MGAGRPQVEGARAHRYRLVCYEQLAGDAQRVIAELTGEGYVAATGTISEGRMTGEVASAGSRATREHLALLIVNDPEIAGRSAKQSEGPR